MRIVLTLCCGPLKPLIPAALHLCKSCWFLLVTVQPQVCQMQLGQYQGKARLNEKLCDTAVQAEINNIVKTVIPTKNRLDEGGLKTHCTRQEGQTKITTHACQSSVPAWKLSTWGQQRPQDSIRGRLSPQEHLNVLDWRNMVQQRKTQNTGNPCCGKLKSFDEWFECYSQSLHCWSSLTSPSTSSQS